MSEHIVPDKQPSATCYTYWGCRCADCTDAARIQVKTSKEKARARLRQQVESAKIKPVGRKKSAKM
jgi:hypothetical protein